MKKKIKNNLGELDSWPDHVRQRVTYDIQTIDYSKLPQD